MQGYHVINLYKAQNVKTLKQLYENNKIIQRCVIKKDYSELSYKRLNRE